MQKFSWWQAIISLIQAELLISFRQRADWLNPLGFLIIIVCLFPLALSPDSAHLQAIAPGVLWIAALLTSLLGIERLFAADYRDGSLEQLLLSPHPLPLLVFAKIFAHWLISGLPVLLISPILGMALHLSGSTLRVLVESLLLGTPVLHFLGAIGMALTVSVRNSSLLLPLLVLPLYIPVLIFGANAVAFAGAGLTVTGQLAILGTFLALSCCLAPLAIAAALRWGVN